PTAMPDTMTPGQRLKAMRANRGRTRPERALAAMLWSQGLRYLTADGYKRRYGRILPGHPDLVFPKKRVTVFVDGCFWHGCPTCKRVPPTMTPFWLNKIQRNLERDRKVSEALQKQGWAV